MTEDPWEAPVRVFKPYSKADQVASKPKERS